MSRCAGPQPEQCWGAGVAAAEAEDPAPGRGHQRPTQEKCVYELHAVH